MVRNVYLKVSLSNVTCVVRGLMQIVKISPVINIILYKAITSLSSLNNLVYYCHSHDCINRVKSIISDWIKANGTSEIKEVVTGLTQQYLSSKHSALQKAVSDLSSRIDKLQAQELELTSEIKNTSKALETHPESIRSQNSN